MKLTLHLPRTTIPVMGQTTGDGRLTVTGPKIWFQLSAAGSAGAELPAVAGAGELHPQPYRWLEMTDLSGDKDIDMGLIGLRYSWLADA